MRWSSCLLQSSLRRDCALRRLHRLSAVEEEGKGNSSLMPTLMTRSQLVRNGCAETSSLLDVFRLAIWLIAGLGMVRAGSLRLRRREHAASKVLSRACSLVRRLLLVNTYIHRSPKPSLHHQRTSQSSRHSENRRRRRKGRTCLRRSAAACVPSFGETNSGTG